VKPLQTVSIDLEPGVRLLFEKAMWVYGDDSQPSIGFRFMRQYYDFGTESWRRLAHRGGALITTEAHMGELLGKAIKAGWFVVEDFERAVWRQVD